jgi:uncharacterized membrane protein
VCIVIRTVLKFVLNIITSLQVQVSGLIHALAAHPHIHWMLEMVYQRVSQDGTVKIRIRTLSRTRPSHQAHNQ